MDILLTPSRFSNLSGGLFGNFGIWQTSRPA